MASVMTSADDDASRDARKGPGDAELTGMSQEERVKALGMTTDQLTGRSMYMEFDPDATERLAYPWTPDVDFNKRTELDCDTLTATEVNAKMRDLMREGYGTIVLKNPRGMHSLGVGILNKLNLIIEGSTGYFTTGLIDGPNVRINGRVGWSCGENMMSGTIMIEKNAGSTFGAAIRGGDLICRGSVGSRTGIDQKGGTIIVGGDTGALSGFMMQRGRMVVCGNAGKNLGDSMYDGTIFVGGDIRSLGVDAVEAELTDLDKKWLTRKLTQYGLMPEKGVDHFTKVVAGKQLWNYDNLEPNEKKLIL
jgi:glutamate synthase domain-containing protein 3